MAGTMLKLILMLCAIGMVSSVNAGDTYVDCVNRIQAPASCSDYENEATSYRRHDGLCNNLRFTTVGAIKTPLRRLINARYVDRRQVDTPRGFPGTSPVIPSANKVSMAAFEAIETNGGNSKKLSTLFMTVGQFLDHDFGLSLHGRCRITDCSSDDTAFQYPCFPIKFDDNNPSACTSFTRAFAMCQPNRRADRRTTRRQINDLTSFVDGSQIYGHNLQLANRLRKLDGSGQLKTRSGNLLPTNTEESECETLGGCSLAGDVRAAENIALYAIHVVWVREHNRVATQLKQQHPNWSGETIYQETRKIVIAEWQHVVFDEWLPRIIDIGSYQSYNSGLDPSLINAFSTAAFRFGHSLVPNAWGQLDSNFDQKFPSVSLRESFFNIQSVNARGIEPTVLGLIGNQSNTVDAKFAFGLARKLFVRPGQAGHVDLTALNIQRGRDHGLPTYGRWRQFCGLSAINTFNDLATVMPAAVAQRFSTIFTNPGDIDLFAAGVSETPTGGFQTGPTFQCLFRIQFKRLRDADRYFFLNPGVFRTQQQRNELQKTSMAKILCDNLDGIVSINKDAFTQTRTKRTLCSSISGIDLSLF